MKGEVHVYPRKNINTDEIIPARYLNTDQEEELAKHAMEGIDEDFREKVKEGDFLVTGENFGCGSSREHAVWALKGAGIRAIIGESFARIFYRNCINNGLVALECKGIHHKVQEENKLEINIREGKIRNLDKREEYQFTPLPKFIVKIIETGGLLPYIKQEDGE